MTLREEVRFKVYTKSSINVTGKNTFPLELIDFIKGDGTYDTSTYKYNIQNAGTYLLGISYNKRNFNSASVCEMKLDRVVDGVTTTRVINRSQDGSSASSLTIHLCIMYKLDVGDELYCTASFGNP